MKAILKLIWFVAAVYVQKFAIKPITPTAVNNLADKINTYSPVKLSTLHIDLQAILTSSFVGSLIFLMILFLGLDIISGDIKGIIKGPLKLVFNAVIYLIGFGVLLALSIGATVTLS